MTIIGITIGDPAGIGPEIVQKVISQHTFTSKVVLYGAVPDTIEFENIPKLSLADNIDEYDSSIYWIPVMEDKRFIPGHPSEESGLAAYTAIERAGIDALNGRIDAIVTAPVSKHYIQCSHSNFIGHTEFFAVQAHVDPVVMSFFSDKINVGLLTTHCALSEVSNFLTTDTIIKKIRIMSNSLQNYLHIVSPEFAVLGLNPHAGENGAFGSEEQKIIMPVVKMLRDEGMNITGPFPSDTFFTGDYSHYDMIIAPYHDQGLIPFKMLAFDAGVNVTLGLPYVRTSVDHGTAFDIAGTNTASEISLLSAIKFAEKMLS